MLGWKHRYLFSTAPFFLPQAIRVEGTSADKTPLRCLFLLFCLLLTFALTTGARFLELPFWNNPAYLLGDEYLLATHDAYHWIAGAEGFEFGAGHPMSEMARLLAQATHTSPAQIGFWLPPFIGGILAIGVFLWGWGLGHPYAGLCAGVLSSLSPAYCARTLLGFYDTDLVVLLFSLLLGLIPALWLAPWLASPLELLWRLIPTRFSAKNATVHKDTAQEAADNTAAASLRSIQRWFDGTSAAQWFFGKNAAIAGTFSLSTAHMHQAACSWPWAALLILSGLFGHWMQDWHSIFPYLTRFSALCLPLLILVLGPAGGRFALLRAALCHALPLLCGIKGGICALIYYALLALQTEQKAGEALQDRERAAAFLSAELPDHNAAEDERSLPPPGKALLPLLHRFVQRAFHSKILLLLCWAGIVAMVFDSTVYDAMMRSFIAYMNRSGDISSASPAGLDPLIFPSVAQSIIEVQTVALPELLTYIYPIEFITVISFICFLYRLALTPVLLWFAPLLVLAFLSMQMGARMIIYAPPVLLLSLCIQGGLLLEAAFFRFALPHMLRQLRQLTGKKPALLSPPAKISAVWGESMRLAASLVCTLCLAWPLVILLPEYTQGPIISSEQAKGLIFIKENTEEDSFVWNWWDWGYATHHFARRHSIADGARHGGPSLFLPAAVYTTADLRFARQLIKYTANKGNIPGNVFLDLSAGQAQQLMRDLGDRSKPLIEAPGRQYVVVSLELLRLGLWVTRYGSWNFETRQASGSLMNNLSQAITFHVDSGTILPDKAQPVYAGTIDIFSPKGLERLSYNRYDAYHFIFNTQPVPSGKAGNHTAGLLELFWEMQRGYLPALAVNDKMVVDEVFYNTMMVQLLLCPKDDPAIAPYFKLVFDNIYTRVYEVL